MALQLVNINVVPLPVVDFSATVTSGCAPVKVDFVDLSVTTNGSVYNWDFGDGAVSQIEEPQHIYTMPGSYQVTLEIVNPALCYSSKRVVNYINVFASPVASFIADPSIASTLSSTIYFENISYGAAMYEWNFGDGSPEDTTLNTQHRFTHPGNYPVTLVAIAQNGCTDTAVDYINIDEPFDIFIPNAFTPNADLINDNFMAYGIGWSDFRMYIFDRWGKKIYFTNDKNKPWTGKAESGNECQADVYVYKLEVYDAYGEMHSFDGRVTLVR